MAKDINKRIAAEISWSVTSDRSQRTKPGRQAFLDRFEREVDPEGVLPSDERRIRAQHALRAHMLSCQEISSSPFSKEPQLITDERLRFAAEATVQTYFANSRWNSSM